MGNNKGNEQMRNDQKARLRNIAKTLEGLRINVEELTGELDEYISDNQDTLDGTERGEKLDGEMEAVFSLNDEFEMLISSIGNITD